MPRHLNLRQIEAFKAVIESGTVSRAADLVHISQPAMSKLIAHLEFDTGLKLFDRVKGRLAPTEHAMRLYGEIDRIFSGVRQVENAVDAILREEQGRLAVGVMPAFAGPFIQRATMGFLKERPNVFCSVQSLGSQWIVEWLVTRKLDVGLVEAGIDNPYITFEPVMEQPLVCVMPHGHPLARKAHIRPKDLADIPFVSLNPDNYLSHQIESALAAHSVTPQTALIANLGPTLCEFVAAGVGVSLIHPLVASGLEGRLVMRPFEPRILSGFQLCRSIDSRNAQLVDAFAEQLRMAAAQISSTMHSALES